jgi:uracil-DNA glycosylase
MAEAANKLRRAARQLTQIDLLLGGDFMPARRNPLKIRGAKAASAAGATPTTGATPAVGAASGAAHAASAVATAPGDDSAPPLSRDEKSAALNAIDADEVRSCVRCRLHEGRSRTVFGEGAPDAALMFVGEGPGEEEDRQGRPFVGRAGQLLNQMIHAMGLKREQVYIANVVKCRPPGNRTPMPDEAATCSGLYLWRQIRIISPRVIVTLGNPATQAILGVGGITKIRGRWHALNKPSECLEGVAVMPTFHPAYLLRQYTPQNRQAVWDDLQKVMERLGLKKEGPRSESSKSV